MPATKKPAGTTVDRRNGRRVQLTPVAGSRFDPPSGLSDEAVAAWDAYWDDAVSGVATAADRTLLVRWVTELDRYLRTVAEADLAPLATGAQGQPVENPLYRVAYRALAVVERYEKQLGIGGLNRTNLGIAVVSQVRSLADMNATYGEGRGGRSGQTGGSAAADPRVIDA